MPDIYPDVMPDLKSYLKANVPSVSGRVFFKIPPTIKKAPFIRIYQSGGGPNLGEVPTMEVRIGCDVWGLQGSDYANVRSTVVSLYEVCHNLPPGTILGTNGTVGLNADVTAAVDVPDPDTGWPRTVLDMVWTVRHT